eukprot:4473740-Pleurochrysis_carterae.AAC.4
MPNEATITHRVVCWEAVYEDEYLPDMEWWGTSPALSKSQWTSLKQDGLKQLSGEFFWLQRGWRDSK